MSYLDQFIFYTHSALAVASNALAAALTPPEDMDKVDIATGYEVNGGKRKKKKNPCFPPKNKPINQSILLKYRDSPACIRAQIRDNPWMLEKGGNKLVGKGPLLDEIKRRKKKNKKTKNKKYK